MVEPGFFAGPASGDHRRYEYCTYRQGYRYRPDNMKRWLRTGKCSFLPEEREWLQTLMSWGLHDSWREKYPEEENLFSWFDYRSKGFNRDPKRGLRIDLLLSSARVYQNLKDAGIAYDICAMEKPSDHCPVWVDVAV